MKGNYNYNHDAGKKDYWSFQTKVINIFLRPFKVKVKDFPHSSSIHILPAIKWEIQTFEIGGKFGAPMPYAIPSYY